MQVISKLSHCKTAAEQPAPKRAKAAPAISVDTLLDKLDKQCATEAVIISEHTDLDTALASLFMALAPLKSEERVRKLAQLVESLPPAERELAHAIGQTLHSDAIVRHMYHAPVSRIVSSIACTTLLVPISL